MTLTRLLLSLKMRALSHRKGSIGLVGLIELTGSIVLPCDQHAKVPPPAHCPPHLLQRTRLRTTNATASTRSGVEELRAAENELHAQARCGETRHLPRAR